VSDPYRYDYFGVGQSQVKEMLSEVLFPWQSLIESYLAMLQKAIYVGELMYNLRYQM